MLTESPLSERQEVARPPASPQLVRKEEISLLDLLIVVAERKLLILKVVLVCVVLGIVVSFLLPIRYKATAVLLPPQQNSSLSTALASQLGNLGGMAALAGGNLGLKSQNDLIVGMLKSRTVEDAMVKKYHLMDEYRSKYPSDARLTFEHHANIESSSDRDGLIRITIDDRDPGRAAELANGYVEQFRDLSEHLAITEASQRRLFFQQQLQDAKDNLANAEEDLKKTELQTGLIQLDSQARALIESAASIRAQIAAKEVQIEALRTFATSENAQLVQAEQELDGLRAQLSKLGGSQNGDDESLIVPKGKVPEAGLLYVRRLREVKYWETIFEILARQFELAKLDEAKQGALIQVVDAAVAPDRRSSPKRTIIVLSSLGAGLLFGIVLAVLDASWRRSKENVETEEKLEVLRRALAFRRAIH